MNERYIEIGHCRVIELLDESRLVCDINIDGEVKDVYFAVDKKYKNYLTTDRSDPFLALMINFAIFTNRKIVCLDPVDEHFLFGIKNQYIKTLSFYCSSLYNVEIVADSISVPYPNQGKTGAAMSFGCDSLYTFFKHYNRSEYPITHLCVFNNGVYTDDLDCINHSNLAREYSINKGLEYVYINCNIHKVLPERYLDVYSQRNMACVLALQGLFSTYLYASGHDDAHFSIDPHNSASYDLLTVENFSTSGLSIVLSGAEATRVEKLKFLLNFEDTYHYLHPCFKEPINMKNCGHCQKDIREMVLLYAWGKQNDFNEVYDFKGFDKRLPMCLGILIALSKQHLYKEVLVEYTKLGFTIPSASYRYAEIYKKLLDNNK